MLKSRVFGAGGRQNMGWALHPITYLATYPPFSSVLPRTGHEFNYVSGCRDEANTAPCRW